MAHYKMNHLDGAEYVLPTDPKQGILNSLSVGVGGGVGVSKQRWGLHHKGAIDAS